MLQPAAAFESLRDAAVARASRPLPVVFASSVAGGALLSASGALVVAVVGGSPQLLLAAPGLARLVAGMVFPAGLMQVLFMRADLLTTTMAHLALPALLPRAAAEGAAAAAAAPPPAPGAGRVGVLLAVTAAGNLVGSVAVAAAFSACVFGADPAIASFVAASAAAKCSLPAGAAFVKGVLANALVNVAVYQATCAKTPGGKIAALWPPIMTFVALGLEHSVANAFLLPLAAFGGHVSWLAVAGNLIPVALGNHVGALLFSSMALLSASAATRTQALAALTPWAAAALRGTAAK
jgi:formate/nitrite transporter FocA (FNT family)